MTSDVRGKRALDRPEPVFVDLQHFDLQYGIRGGENVIAATRSSTAEFHGNAYYFSRNEATIIPIVRILERCLESEHVRKDQRDEREFSHHAIRVEDGVLIA